MSLNSKNGRQGKRIRDLEYSEKLLLIDGELMSFYLYCEQMGFTEAEMEVICSPLFEAMQKNTFKKMLKTVIAVMILAGFIYSLVQISSVALHLSAVGRIVMIKALPIWDWRSLFYESCLISNPFYSEYTITEDDCVTCEALERIEKVKKVSYEYVLGNYLSRDAPLIVTDAMSAWPVMNTDDFYFDNITQLYLQDEKLVETVPCILTTNLRTGSSDLLAFLTRIHNPSVDKWFVHWQNCDIYAVKALRKFYQRPYFLSSVVSAAHFNWVLMSSDYNTNNYKKVELDSGLIMLAQLRGSTFFKLSPLNPCNISCPELLADLQEGEMLVFTNYLWNFEYRPGHRLDSVAILTETVWGESNT